MLAAPDRSVSSALAAARALLRRGRDEILADQSARLSALVRYAARHVPHYRELFGRHGLDPERVRGVEDLAAIPITTRADVQASAPVAMVAKGLDPARLLVTRTTGSSGRPIHIRRTWLEERILVAFRLRALHDLGLRVTDRRASLVLSIGDPREWRLPQRLLQAAGLYRTHDVSCLLAPVEIERELAAFRPDVLAGYPGILARVAAVAGGARPRLVVPGGEVLTAQMRQRIAEGFGASVCELYGSHEFKTIAWECRLTGLLHVADDSVVLEVLDGTTPVGPGGTGEVVATALYSYAMPFIRYRLGDIVTRGPSPCPCGRPFSTIRAVQGRMLDYFPLPGGQLIHPYELTQLTKHASWIGQQRVIQERLDRIVVYLVPAERPAGGDVRAIEQALARRLGPEVRVSVALVNDMPMEPNGKFRVHRSLVHSEYDDTDWDGRRATGPTPPPRAAHEC
jgi:phenylacetate-coenzyme A ligase PaaK-like adenylate-forming protein